MITGVVSLIVTLATFMPFVAFALKVPVRAAKIYNAKDTKVAKIENGPFLDIFHLDSIFSYSQSIGGKSRRKS